MSAREMGRGGMKKTGDKQKVVGKKLPLAGEMDKRILTLWMEIYYSPWLQKSISALWTKKTVQQS